MIETAFENGASVFSAQNLPGNLHDGSVYLTYESNAYSSAIADHLSAADTMGQHYRALIQVTDAQQAAHSEWYIVHKSSSASFDAFTELEGVLTGLGIKPSDLRTTTEPPKKWPFVFAALVLVFLLFLVFLRL